MELMFFSIQDAIDLDLRAFDTSKCTNMKQCFYQCTNVKSIDMSTWDTSKVTTMNQMFMTCMGLTKVDISNFDSTSLTDTAGMFMLCSKLKTLIINNPKVFPMTNTNMLQSTLISSSPDAFVYVPDDLVDTYKQAENWSTYAEKIKPISELKEE